MWVQILHQYSIITPNEERRSCQFKSYIHSDGRHDVGIDDASDCGDSVGDGEDVDGVAGCDVVVVDEEAARHRQTRHPYRRHQQRHHGHQLVAGEVTH